MRRVKTAPKRYAKNQRHYQSRWTIAIHAVLLIAITVPILWLMIHQFATAPQGATTLAHASLQPVPSSAASVIPSPTVSAPAAPTSVATTTSATPLPPVTFTPSDVKQLYIPAANPDLTINTVVAPMPTSCMEIINPPQRTRAEARGVYHCTDFSGAGTDAPGTTVIAGHASLAHSWNTVFDHLQLWDNSIVGHTVYIRTATSQGHWLRYKVTNVYRPSKTTGVDNTIKQEIWRPTPGRLLLLTCLELGDAPSVDNYIVVAQYEGIQK